MLAHVFKVLEVVVGIDGSDFSPMNTCHVCKGLFSHWLSIHFESDFSPYTQNWQ